MKTRTKRLGVMSGALPAAVALWQAATRLRTSTNHRAGARKWVRVAITGLGVAGLAALAASTVGRDAFRRGRTERDENERLDEALIATFPASDPPAITPASS